MQMVTIAKKPRKQAISGRFWAGRTYRGRIKDGRLLEKYYPDVKYVNRLMTHSWGQKVIRFYDPDGNLIEVGTPM